MNARPVRAMRLLTPSPAARERESAINTPSPQPSPTVAGEGATATVALLLLVRLRSAAWGLSRLVHGERALGKVAGLRFARVLGSGRGGGFGLTPGLDHQGLMCFFDDEESARAFAQEAPVVRAYRDHAHEVLLALLRATSCRGTWSGASLAVTATAQTDAPMAALTRASIRLRHAARFWQHAPATHDAQAMDAYARSGAHLAAIQGAHQQGWFSESMFVRFAPIEISGEWHGKRYG